MFPDLMAGFQSALEPSNLLFVLLGTVVGIAVGSVPGLDCSVGTALVLPLTFAMTPTQAIIFLAGLYAGGVYGGQIPAILFRVPGASEAVMTTLDGYPMAQQGRAGKALGIGLISSFFGGMFSVVALVVLAPPLADMALRFGPPEYFALAVLGLSAISSLGTKSQSKAIVSGLLGLLIATVGIDPITGINRFTFGTPALQAGIGFIPAVIGLFAASEVFRQIEMRSRYAGPDQDELSRIATAKIELPSFPEVWRLKWSMIRSAFVGLWLGILPGVGATTAAIVGYAQAVRFSKHPERFGKGEMEGVMAAETANNAATGGAMIPLLALGIPGSATTAIMIGAFLIHGLRPGPLFLMQQKPLAFTIFAGMALSQVIFLVLGFFAVKPFSKLLQLPYPYLAANIFAFSAVGAVAMGDFYGMQLMLVFAVVGFVLEKYGFSVAPMVLGLVLGPIAETSLRRGLLIVDYDVGALLTRPITAAFLALALLSLLWPIAGQVMAARKSAVARAAESNQA
jgi:putative tricarboxylic transport membrane protein